MGTSQKKKTAKARSGTQKDRRDRELSRLRHELEAERRHSARLERRVSELRKEIQERDAVKEDNPWKRLRHKPRAEEQMVDTSFHRAARYRKRTYLRYLFEAVMDSTPLQMITNIWSYLRRLRIIQMVVTIVLALGAVVTVTVVSAAALPFILFAVVGVALLGRMLSRRMNRILKDALGERHIRVLVPPRGAALKEGSFYLRQARAMAAEEHVAVLIVTPYLLSSRGTGRGGSFLTGRKSANGLYFVRRHYFFQFRRKVLDALDANMTIIY